MNHERDIAEWRMMNRLLTGAWTPQLINLKRFEKAMTKLLGGGGSVIT
jgi:hypothetical protein